MTMTVVRQRTTAKEWLLGRADKTRALGDDKERIMQNDQCDEDMEYAEMEDGKVPQIKAKTNHIETEGERRVEARSELKEEDMFSRESRVIEKVEK